MVHFQALAGEAQVSSRLGGSTVFTVSQGPILAPILGHFGTLLGPMGSKIVAKGPPGLPGWAPLVPPSASPESLGAAMEASFMSCMASGTP